MGDGLGQALAQGLGTGRAQAAVAVVAAAGQQRRAGGAGVVTELSAYLGHPPGQ